MRSMINIALPKGRLGEKAYAMLKNSGYDCPAMEEPGRRLIFENPEKGVRYFWVKPSDVAIYVERGAADLGIVGKDILLEYQPDVYELLDLRMGKCRMAVAGKRDFSQVKGDGSIDIDITRKALDALGVDYMGLENLDREILRNIIDRFDGGPVGIDTIAASIGEERVTIEDVYEPYLIQIGFLNRTKKGRVVSQAAYRHLGLDFSGDEESQLELDI